MEKKYLRCVQNGLEMCVGTYLSQAEQGPFNPTIAGGLKNAIQLQEKEQVK